MTLADAAEELAVSQSPMYALVKSGDLQAVQVGGRGQWRIKLGEYIARMYDQAENQRGKHEAGRSPQVKLTGQNALMGQSALVRR